MFAGAGRPPRTLTRLTPSRHSGHNFPATTALSPPPPVTLRLPPASPHITAPPTLGRSLLFAFQEAQRDDHRIGRPGWFGGDATRSARRPLEAARPDLLRQCLSRQPGFVYCPVNACASTATSSAPPVCRRAARPRARGWPGGPDRGRPRSADRFVPRRRRLRPFEHPRPAPAGEGVGLRSC